MQYYLRNLYKNVAHSKAFQVEEKMNCHIKNIYIKKMNGQTNLQSAA